MFKVKLSKLRTVFFMFSFLISFQIIAQENKKDTLQTTNKIHLIDEVIVTATRTERQLSSLPLPAKIIKKKEIKSTNTMRLNELLDEQTGLVTVPDFGGGQGIQVQGMDAAYTMIMIDGVPLVGRLAGTLDLSRITVGNIEKIEIIKGASSCLYGSEAMGGVINIITENHRNNSDIPKLKTNLEYRLNSIREDIFNTHDISALSNYTSSKIKISLFANMYKSNGYDFNKEDLFKTLAPFTNYTFHGKIIYDMNAHLRLFVSQRGYFQNQHNLSEESGNPLTGLFKTREYNSHFRLNYKKNKWEHILEMYGTQYKTDEFLDRKDGSRYSSSFFDQILLRPELRSIYKNNWGTFAVGIGFTRESLERSSFTTQPVFESPYLYGQYDFIKLDKFNLILGARYDMHNEYQSQFSPKIAVRYEINSWLNIKGSMGYGYKAPDFRQLYLNYTNTFVGYTILGYNMVQERIRELQNNNEISKNLLLPLSTFNEPLKPESSVNYNIGMSVNPLPNFSCQMNLFRNDIKNLIDSYLIVRRAGDKRGVYTYTNVDEVYTQGLEYEFTYEPWSYLKIKGGYQWLFAKDKKAIQEFKEGKVFVRKKAGESAVAIGETHYFGLYNRSRHMANVKFICEIFRWKTDINIRGTYRSKYGLNDTNGNEYLDDYDDFVAGYSIWDFAVNKEFSKYKISLGINNIFNFQNKEQITNIVGINSYVKFKFNF